MKLTPLDDLVVVPRPHFALQKDCLYFLLSTRPLAELDADEALLWTTLDGKATVGQLESMQPGAKTRLQRLWDLGVCEFAETEFPTGRRRVLVVEPHMDDAILSVGGLMWSLRKSCEFTLVTVGGRSNFTSYYVMRREFFDIDKVSQLRKAESNIVMQLLGGKHVDLALSEAPLRYRDGNWKLDWFKQHRKSVGGFIGHSTTDRDIESWAVPLEQALAETEADEIWMPLGIGGHADHELTRNACLRILARKPTLASDQAIYFYQDVPYVNSFRAHASQLLCVLRDAGAQLDQRLEDVSQAFDAKLRLLSIYGSQFKMSYMAPKVDAAARHASTGNGRHFECLYRLFGAPRAIDPFQLYSGRQFVEELAVRLVPWYARNRLARHIRIISPMAAGRWGLDVGLLLDLFPNATLELHVSEDNLAETEELLSPRVEVQPVHGRNSAWLRRVLKLSVSRPYPMIVLPGESRGKAGHAIKLLCPLADTVVGTRMTHLMLALQRHPLSRA